MKNQDKPQHTRAHLGKSKNIYDDDVSTNERRDTEELSQSYGRIWRLNKHLFTESGVLGQRMKYPMLSVAFHI